MKIFFIVLSMVPLIGGLAYGVAYFFGPEAQPPGTGEMWRYVREQATEDRIRDVIARSKTEMEQEKIRAKEQAQDYWEKRVERWEKCKDEIVKWKSDECNTPSILPSPSLGEPMPWYRSLDERMYHNLLGLCLYARTVREAKEWGCLPP